MSRLAGPGSVDARHHADPGRRRSRSRRVPPALRGHELFHTGDVREACTRLGRVLSPHTLTVADPDRFAAGVHGIRLRSVSMLHLDVAGPATLDVPAAGPYFAVHVPTRGRALCTVGATRFAAGPTRALVTGPGTALTMEIDHDSPQLVIRIEQDALAGHLTRLLGGSLDRPIVFEPALDLTTGAALRWHGAVALLHSEVLHADSLVRRGHGIGSLEELLMSTLLLLQPSNHHAHLVGGRPGGGAVPARRRVVREAVDYIEGHLAEHVTMDDIAGCVHMSVRAVQQGFHDELGTTPMLYLRDRRLERAREDLTDAPASDGVTVADVAHRWGFTHLGWFAALYRARWGEPPSRTLRR